MERTYYYRRNGQQWGHVTTVRPSGSHVYGCLLNIHGDNWQRVAELIARLVHTEKKSVGGQIVVYDRQGVKLPDRRGPKEKSTMIHDRKGLISMNPTQSLNEFVITLGPAPILNDNYIIFGEIINGFKLFEDINANGLRNISDTDGGGQSMDLIDIYSCGETNGTVHLQN